MTLDIRTLYLVLVLLNLLQIIALFVQFKINKSYNGVGWWLLWSVFDFFGFGLTLFRDIPGIFNVVATLQNTFIISGTVCIYVGFARFLDKRESLSVILAIYTLFFAGFFYFLFIHDSSDHRGIVINFTLSAIAFLAAQTILANNIPSIHRLMKFIASALIVHGVILLYRSYLMIFFPVTEDMLEPVFYNLLPIFDALVMGLVLTLGFITMINQRLQYDITLTKDHFQSIFSLAPGAVLITTADTGEIIDVNDTFTQITGLSREESLGKTTTDIGLWKGTSGRESLINEIVEKGICHNKAIVFNKKSGEEFIGLVSGRFITLFDKPHIISITQDVTEKYEAEEKIKASEEKYRTLTETTPDIILLHDPNGIITYINKAGLTLVGQEEKEILGRSIKEFIPEDFFEEVKKRQKLRLEGITETFEYKTRLHNDDGKFITIWVRSSPIIKNGKMDRFLIVGQDITQQENNLIELIKAKEAAEEVNKLKSYFFANMSHELRTPFVGILGYAQLISERLNEPDNSEGINVSELSGMAHRITISSERLMHTLNKILDLSKLEFEQVAVTISEFDLNSLLHDVSKIFTKMALDKNLEIVYNELSRQVRIKSDEKMLNSILVNLMSNAVKYTAQGTITLSAEIIERQEKENLLIKVSDTGIGIPADKLEVIWGAFRQVSEGHGRSFEGTGLGLTITKKYVDMLRGEISVESVEGVGSTFTVILPMKYYI